MNRTRVKICGITRVEDALTAVDNGADAIGLVFYDPSPRAVSVDQAAEIVQNLPGFVTAVALFVNAPRAKIEEVLSVVRPGLLQFHGDETPEECAQFNHDFIKAIRVNEDTNLIQCAQDFHSAKGLLLDTYAKGKPGGTGQVFDWELIPPQISSTIILAGGLDQTNVREAIRKVNPYAVDVSGGVELKKGVKDPEKIKAFMQIVSQS